MAKLAACPPAETISDSTCCSFSTLRAARATLAPWDARRNAHARPIPCEAPVTSATRLSSGFIKGRIIEERRTANPSRANDLRDEQQNSKTGIRIETI